MNLQLGQQLRCGAENPLAAWTACAWCSPGRRWGDGDKTSAGGVRAPDSTEPHLTRPDLALPDLALPERNSPAPGGTPIRWAARCIGNLPLFVMPESSVSR